MTYYTRQGKVRELSRDEIHKAIGVTVQAWGDNLDDINKIVKSINPGRVLMVDPTTETIKASPLALGNAAYKNTGTGVGNVVIVGSTGKIDTSLLPPASSLSAYWGNYILAAKDSGMVAGDTTVLLSNSNEPMNLLAGSGIKITGSTVALSKSIKIEVIPNNNFLSVSADAGTTLTPAVSTDTLRINGGNSITTVTAPASQGITLNYTGTQFATINADLGTRTSASATETINIKGSTEIQTVLSGSTLNINYTGKQWKTLTFTGYNYNMLGTGVQTAQNKNDALEIKAGFGIAIESDTTNKKVTIRSQYLEWAVTTNHIDGGNYGELYNGKSYNGGTYYAYDGGTY